VADAARLEERNALLTNHASDQEERLSEAEGREMSKKEKMETLREE